MIYIPATHTSCVLHTHDLLDNITDYFSRTLINHHQSLKGIYQTKCFLSAATLCSQFLLCVLSSYFVFSVPTLCSQFLLCVLSSITLYFVTSPSHSCLCEDDMRKYSYMMIANRWRSHITSYICMTFLTETH